MQLTQATDYAFRVVLYLSGLPAGSIVSGQNLAAKQSIPQRFLQKVMHALVQAGLVRSHRGADGGFELTKLPEKITLKDVIMALEGPISINRCLSEQASCSRHCARTCPVHAALDGIQERFIELLQNADFATLAQECKGKVE